MADADPAALPEHFDAMDVNARRRRMRGGSVFCSVVANEPRVPGYVRVRRDAHEPSDCPLQLAAAARAEA